MVVVSSRFGKEIKTSGDGSKVLCPFHNSIKAWSIQTGEVVGEVEFEPSYH